MSTFLFDTVIFGPVWSRRLGESLGINLLPAGKKVCNFNCIYCECGITPDTEKSIHFPSVESVSTLLEQKLTEMKKAGEYLDCITFAGNGEPTLHPHFPDIVNETIKIRNRLFPNVKIAVLSNATLITAQHISEALCRIDLNILKLDSAIESTLYAINCPRGSYQMSEIIAGMKQFQGKLIIQTLFLNGSCNGVLIDNTTVKEVDAWLEVLKEVLPQSVMIYSLARDTAVQGLQSVSAEVLNSIAERVCHLGINTMVTP